MVLTNCPKCNQREYNPITQGCRACGFITPWMGGSPTPYQTTQKAPKHGYLHLPTGGSLVAVAPIQPTISLSENQSIFLPVEDLNQLLHEAATSGSPVSNITASGASRLNIIYNAHRPTGKKRKGGKIVTTYGVRIVLWDYPEYIHWYPDDEVPGPNDRFPD